VKKNIGSQFQDIEIPAIIKDLHGNQRLPDLLVYNSLSQRSRFLRGKPFRSKHFSMIIVLSGMLNVKVNLFEYEIRKNDVIIIPPSAIRELNWKEDDLHFVSLLFTPDFLQRSGVMGKYFNVASFMNEGLMSYRKIEKEDTKILKDLLDLIGSILNSNLQHITDIEVVRNLFRAILLKIKRYFDKMETDQKLSGTIIYKYLKLLSEHYLLHREVSFYANKLNLSPKYLTQLLKRKTGKTARYFISDMVVMEAKILLDNRFFKQFEGISPTKYRNGL